MCDFILKTTFVIVAMLTISASVAFWAVFFVDFFREKKDFDTMKHHGE